MQSNRPWLRSQAIADRRGCRHFPQCSEIAVFMLRGMPSDASDDKLWPQLWAMQQVEPLVSTLLERLRRVPASLERAIESAGGHSPRAEALCLMSMLRSEVLFLGTARRWASDRQPHHVMRNDYRTLWK